MQQIRFYAPELLVATKAALRYLRGVDNPSEASLKVMATLRTAIDAADPPRFDESLSSIKLVMTRPSAASLLATLELNAQGSESDKHVFEEVKNGMRFTKQRVYLTLGIEHVVLRRLRYVLEHTNAPNQNKVFERLAKQIAKEGLAKNPMEILGQMGL